MTRRNGGFARTAAFALSFSLLTALAARALPPGFDLTAPTALALLLGAALVEEFVFRKLLLRYALVQIAAFTAVASLAYGNGVSSLPFFLVAGVFATAVARAFSWKASFAYRALVLLALPLAASDPAQAFSLFLWFGALAAPLLEHPSLERATRHLSLHRFNARRALVHGTGLFALLFVLLAVQQLVLGALGALDAHAVADFIRSQGAPTLLFAVLAAPVAEELAFRGYLQKKTGVVLASLVFAGLHYGFGSTAELVAAFTAALVLGYYVRQHDDVYPAIVGHSLYNASSILFVTSGLVARVL